MSSFIARRRFIAGVVCPRCGASDTTVIYIDADTRECVTCGYSEDRPASTPVQEPHTRVNSPQRRTDTEAEAVRLVDSTTDSPGKGRT